MMASKLAAPLRGRLQQAVRGIATIPEVLEPHIEVARRESTKFHAELQHLQASPKTYQYEHVTSGQAYTPSTQTVKIPTSRPFGADVSESVRHETHHGYQHERARTYFDSRYPKMSPTERSEVLSDFMHDPVHKTVFELSALPSGIHTDTRPVTVDDVIQPMKNYWGKEGYSGDKAAVLKQLFNHPAHESTRSALKKMNISPEALRNAITPSFNPIKE